MKNIIKIGTRKSKLALIQTDIVKDKIKKAFPEIEVEIVKIDTKGYADGFPGRAWNRCSP